jgi:hypothetical protein
MKRLSGFHKRTAIPLLLSLVLSGCSTRIPLSKEDPSQWTTRSKIWVILKDGRQYQVTNPEISDSKLRGYFHPDDRRQIDISEIESLSIKELDKTRTFGLVAWSLVAAGVLISILVDEDESKSKPCPS